MNETNEAVSAGESETAPARSRPGVSDEQVQRWVSWIAVGGIVLLAMFFNGFMAYQMLQGLPADPAKDSWLITLLNAHYSAMVGTPMSAVTAFCIVTLLKVTNGPIEFEAVGFKFRGASGPIVFWLLCFLAITSAFHLLWTKPA